MQTTQLQKSGRITLKALLMGSTLAMVPVAALPALAQQEDSTARMETVTVTATGRAENVTDVPYNITALSGQSIEAAQMFDEAELLRSIPGVTVIDRGARNAGTVNSARIRGLAVDSAILGDYAVSSVASVSTYVNDTPMFAGFTLLDLERVEALRGPQGTLYGSGSLGGTIRYITKNPELGEYGGYVSASASSVKGSGSIGWSTEGAANIPLGNKAALRVVGTVADYPGITDYVNVYELDSNGLPVAPDGVLAPTASYRVVKDADTFENWMGRATLLVEPTDALSLRLIHTRQSDDVGGRRQQTMGLDGYGNRYDRYENGSIQLEPSSRDLNMTSLEAELDVGFATLTSSTSHYDHEGDSTSENTGFYAQAGWLSFYYTYPRPMASAIRTYSDEAVIQELRLTTDDGGNFDYVAGAYYNRQQRSTTQDSILVGFKRWWDAWAGPGAVTGDQDWKYVQSEHFTETALFGELTWHVSDSFDLTAGARYFSNESKNNTYMDLPLWAGLFSPVTANFQTDESDTLFKINAAWNFSDDDMLYATISEGYRRGGANAVPLSGSYAENPAWQQYKSDSVVNYEIGLKGSRSKLIYDVSAFYIDWNDPQLNTSTTNWGFFAVQNASSARTYGLESTVQGTIGEDWGYTLGYSYIDAKLTADFYAPGNTTTPTALDGAVLPGTPEHQLNWALNNTTQLGDWRLFSRVDGYYQSETRNAVSRSPTFNVPLDGFSIWNATATASRDALDLSIWVKNIFNEEGITGMFTEAYMGTAPAEGYYGNGSKAFIALPRTIGITARYNF